MLERDEAAARAVRDVNQLQVDVPVLSYDCPLEEQVHAWAYQASIEASGHVQPNSVAEALSGPDSKRWKAAIDAELNAMTEFKVWDPVPVQLPPGKKAVGSKLILKIKRNQDGTVDKFKARLCALGCSQVPGKDVGDTFSNVGKWPTIRLLLALAAVMGWEVEVVDVKNAFLQAPLKEEVYLRQPEGLGDGTTRVYRLRRAMYGLKQAPRSWEHELGAYLVSLGFKRCTTDCALYVRHSVENGQTVLILVYVDDLLLVGHSKSALQRVREELKKGYQISELGDVSAYLGLQVTRDRKAMTLSLSLPKYISELEERFAAELSAKHPSYRGLGSPLTPDQVKHIRNPLKWKPEESLTADRAIYMRLLVVPTWPSLSVSCHSGEWTPRWCTCMPSSGC